MKSPDSPRVVLQLGAPGEPARWRRFDDPREILIARRSDEIPDLVARIEQAADDGLHAVGYLAYEAGPVFDPSIAAHEPDPDGPPLAWWALFDDSGMQDVETLDDLPIAQSAEETTRPRPLLDEETYRDKIAAIHEHIAAGNTYQVNFTFPLRLDPAPDAWTLFRRLNDAQRARYGAFLDLGRFAICSASPELLFDLQGDLLISRPMKGTARRGRFADEDARLREELARSVKDRAENVMIVDMTRNDLGRVARTGTVQVDDLFTVETYPTVHQLTSTVRARSDASLFELLCALFPAASITGAPKVRTSRIIRKLEIGPRGVYTGSIGYVGPGRRMQWNVAIRTSVIDRKRANARYDVGGGIVWDSRAASEWQECRAKALVLTRGSSWSLLETMLRRARSGYFLLDRHLDRLRASAAHFGFPLDEDLVRRRLEEISATLSERSRVRLLVDENGDVRCEAFPAPFQRTTWRVRLDDRPVDHRDLFLCHKTTRRRVYDEALARHADVDDVLLWNDRGELTESTRANLVVRIDDEWLTPPVSCGLLAGTYRAALLERGRLRERVLPVSVLDLADEVYLINSVRGRIRTVFVDPPAVAP